MVGTGPRKLGPLHDPPDDFSSRKLPVCLESGPWIRLHECGRAAKFFGRTGENRFDAPAGEYGVLYAAADRFCAFVEVFGDPPDRRFVSWTDLARACWSSVIATRPARLADLTGGGLRRMGADARLFAGDHVPAQRWALAIWKHPDQPDGILYRPRHDPSRVAVALFDRGAAVIETRPIGRVTDDRMLLAQILDQYGFVLVA